MEYIIIFTIVTIAIFVYITLSSRKEKQKRIDLEEKNDILKETDAIISRYNRCISEYKMVVDSLMKRIRNTEDMNSMDKLNALITSYESACIEAEKILSSIKPENITEYTTEELCEQNENADTYVCEMEDSLKLITKIRPIRQEQYENNKPFSYDKIYNAQSVFFSGCESETAVKSRYHALTKTFHPDSGIGDPDVFRQIKLEYDKEIKKYSK